MSRPEEAREPVPDTTADWYRRFEAELASRGLPTSEVERTATSTRAEAEAAGETPGDLYGPAVLYAREVASALRDYQADVPAPAPHNSSPHATAGLGATSPTTASAKTSPATPVVLRLTDVSARRGRRTVLSGINLTITGARSSPSSGPTAPASRPCFSSAQACCTQAVGASRGRRASATRPSSTPWHHC